MSSINILDNNPPELFEKIEDYISKLDPPVLKYENGIIIPSNFSDGVYTILDKRPYSWSYDKNHKRIYGSYSHSTITDIFRLTKYYFPEAKIVDVYNVLLSKLSEGEFRSWICKDICKRTYDTGNGFSGGLSSYPMDEYGVIFPANKLKAYVGYGLRHEKDLLKFNI